MAADDRRSHWLITPERLAKDAIIYIRQSTPGQARENWGSTEVQREQETLATAYGWPPSRIRVIDEDLGKSGATTAGRSGFKEMVRLLGAGTVGAIFAVHVSRIARNVADFEVVRQLCEVHGVVLIADGRPCDFDDPGDVVFAQVQASFAESDNRTRAKSLRRARYAKAERGSVVSMLPVGWVEGVGGQYEFDPEVKPAIDQVHATFRQVGTVRGTVKALAAAGVQLPSRWRGRLHWDVPRYHQVYEFITNTAYAGTYTFGRTEMRRDADGAWVQVPLPEDRWIVQQERLPAYLTVAEQATFRDTLKRNTFGARDRPGRGSALCQGVLRCGQCGARLTVADPRTRTLSHYYQCTAQATMYGAAACMAFPGRDFDAVVERLVLTALEAPTLDILRDAIANARAAERAEAEARQAQLDQLRYRRQAAFDRWQAADPRNCRVQALAQDLLEKATAALEAYEQQLHLEPVRPEVDGSEHELRELCAIAADVPGLWRHPAVTNKDRKTLLRCLITEVVVSRSEEAILGSVHWVSGAISEFRVLRRKGMEQLVARLHREGHSAVVIRNILAEGDAATGQRWERTTTAIYQVLRRLGLKPNPPGRRVTPAREEARRLYALGLTYDAILKELRCRGYLTLRGGPVTAGAVSSWIGNAATRREQLEQIHIAALRDAKTRGLTASQAAADFNARSIPRVGGRPWTADAVRQRRTHLTRQVSSQFTSQCLPDDTSAPARA